MTRFELPTSGFRSDCSITAAGSSSCCHPDDADILTVLLIGKILTAVDQVKASWTE